MDGVRFGDDDLQSADERRGQGNSQTDAEPRSCNGWKHRTRTGA